MGRGRARGPRQRCALLLTLPRSVINLSVNDALRPPGILPPSTPVAPLLNAPSPTARSQRHFSAFPLTSHLHTPTLRLVSLHPFLSLTFSFLRVPEIHDGFLWKLFISRGSSVRSALDAVIDELGLTKALPIPGGGALEYVLEEVWADDHFESKPKGCVVPSSCCPVFSS